MFQREKIIHSCCRSPAAMASKALPKSGLIVEQRWLDLILSGEKVLEIRGTNTLKRGLVGLIKSGSNHVFGEVEIVNTFTIDRDAFHLYYQEHCVPDAGVVPYKVIHAWCLARPKRYEKPVKYVHPRGAIIWVNLKPEQRVEETTSTKPKKKMKRSEP